VSWPCGAPVSGSTCGGKKRSLAPAEQTRDDVAEARAAWQQWQAAAPALRPTDVVFVDECGIATDMARRYGRAAGGQRARGAVPHGRWTRLTVLGGLTLAGLTACMSIEGAADTAVMVAFVEHVLVPTLTPGQVVVLDNLSVHRAARVRELVEQAGCTLRFLPPYSPDLNPIEPAWSKLKTLLRGVGARTTATLEQALAGVITAITPDDARGYFHHCGYGRSATP
jgi:transposase